MSMGYNIHDHHITCMSMGCNTHDHITYTMHGHIICDFALEDESEVFWPVLRKLNPSCEPSVKSAGSQGLQVAEDRGQPSRS